MSHVQILIMLCTKKKGFLSKFQIVKKGSKGRTNRKEKKAPKDKKEKRSAGRREK